MTERPILFNAEMVRAILDGRKTQTRRVVKPQPLWIGDPGVPFKTSDADPAGIIKCPYGKPGDELWVRETHYRWTGCGLPPSSFNKRRCYVDHPELDSMDRGCCLVKVPSIHMPRWASRIQLRIKYIRIERVQDITDEGAKAEGVWSNAISMQRADMPMDAFGDRWQSIYGTWDKNPWVWVIDFERVKP